MRRSARSCPRMMWEGPADELTLTENAQPALMAVSLAAMRVLEAEAGLDLARDANSSPAIRSANIRRSRRPARFRIADTARLLRIRGHAMQKAVPVGQGAMAALLGLEFDAARGGRAAKPRRARSARPPTTMAAGRS